MSKFVPKHTRRVGTNYWLQYDIVYTLSRTLGSKTVLFLMI